MSIERCPCLKDGRKMTSSPDVLVLADVAGSKTLVTRDQGRVLLEGALSQLDNMRILHVDMSGIDALSPSFADEFFGGLLERLGGTGFRERVRVENHTEELRMLIRKVLGHRKSHPRM